MKLYKLMDKDTGLFSAGGCYGGTNVRGKTWSSLANLKSHLRMRYTRVMPGPRYRTEVMIPEKWVVVEIEYTPMPNMPYKCLAKELFSVDA